MKILSLIILVIALQGCQKKTVLVSSMPPAPKIQEIADPAPDTNGYYVFAGDSPVPMIQVPKSVIVYFDFDSYTIRRDQERKLEEIVNVPGKRIVLTGHTCEIGAEEYNLALGENRANEVKLWLYSHGAQNQVVVNSKGEFEPVSGEHEKNRRVEIVIE